MGKNSNGVGLTRTGTRNEMEDFPPVFAGYYFFTRMILYSSCLHAYSLLQLGIMKKKSTPWGQTFPVVLP